MTPEEVGDVVITAPMYGGVAVPGVVTYPVWKSASDAHDRKHQQVKIEKVEAEYGQPIARYVCQGVEVWEYAKPNELGEYFRLLLLPDTELEVDLDKASSLEGCVLQGGKPIHQADEFWLAEILPCGLNYKTQVHNRHLFYLDMGEIRE